MKYRDHDTGELKDIYVKASDTLPIGAEVDYNGTEVPEGWEEVDELNLGDIIVDDIKCKNIFNKYSVLNGYELVNTSGTVSPNSGWFVSDYIEVEPNKSYYLSGNRTYGSTNAFYDINKNYLGYVSGITGLINTPANTKYIRFNGRLSELDNNIQLEKGTVATKYVEHKEFNNKQIYSTIEHVVGKWIDGKLVYEKTVIYTHSGTIGKLNEMVTIDIPHGINNFEHVVDDVKGFSSTGNVLPLLNGTSSTTQSVNIAFVNAANIQMRIINVQITARTWYLTLRYTKTTDSITTTSSDEQINEEATI